MLATLIVLAVVAHFAGAGVTAAVVQARHPEWASQGDEGALAALALFWPVWAPFWAIYTAAHDRAARHLQPGLPEARLLSGRVRPGTGWGED